MYYILFLPLRAFEIAERMVTSCAPVAFGDEKSASVMIPCLERMKPFFLDIKKSIVDQNINRR